MTPLWTYLWPCFAAGLLVGVICGTVAFRWPTKRYQSLAFGLVITLVLVLLWHGPVGGADRFSAEVERGLQRTLVHYEMQQVSAHLHHGPLTRRVLLSGPADEFQRTELVRLINQLPGVADTRWSRDGGGVPLILEGLAVGGLGFLFGLLLAYLVELHRRYNAQWNW